MTKGRIVFTGSFWEYFVISFGLMVLVILTLGILLPVYAYWSIRWFFGKMEIELYDGGNTNTIVNVPASTQHPTTPQ